MDPGDQQHISLDILRSWNTDSLRDFLSRRGLSRNGNKDELVALCYAALQMNIPIKQSESQYISQNSFDYNRLLRFDDTNVRIPDPLTLCEGWLKERTGLSRWPPVSLSDIVAFFITNTNNDQARVRHFMNEYKVGKAYEYFQSKWLKELFYHEISPSSEYCVVRAKCTPSQRVNDPDHTVWACIIKDSGEIKSAYCSCTAGLGQTCNHVAGLLFRLESANKLGLTSCTSLPCTWDVPTGGKLSTKELMVPKPVCEMLVKKSRYGKENTRPLASDKKRAYQPMVTDNCVQDLISKMSAVLPNAVLCKGLDKNVQQPSYVPGPVRPTTCKPSAKPKDPSTISVKYLHMANIAGKVKTCQQLIDTQPKLSAIQVQHIQVATVGQAKNPDWCDIRKGRITASNFYPVYTRVNTFLRKPESDTQGTCMLNIISQIMGYSGPKDSLIPIKFGIESEQLGKDNYCRLYKLKHTNPKFSECGIFLDADHSYLGASPDLIVSCDCCGEGLLEVKSTLALACSTCSGFCTCNLPEYLYFLDGCIHIKTNHRYYCQMQGQMAICHKKWCDLFVYSCNGGFMQRVSFDQAYYDKIFVNLQFFFERFIVSEVLTRSVQKQIENEQGNTISIEKQLVDATYICFCLACQCEIKEGQEVQSFSERSICCDKCNKWFHFKCVKITQAFLNKKSNWYCNDCCTSETVS